MPIVIRAWGRRIRLLSSPNSFMRHIDHLGHREDCEKVAHRNAEALLRL